MTIGMHLGMTFWEAVEPYLGDGNSKVKLWREAELIRIDFGEILRWRMNMPQDD